MSGSAPSTATVLEFRCLFTHDLRRKQKRWQDGRLKYHSFNARVMVYDERGNSVGDMHWHGEYDFGEGEEVQLDRGGVMVQVEDLVERRETDLTELVDKRIQEKQQRQIQQLARSAASGAALPRSLPRPPPLAPDRVQPQLHRPLHRVIGTPTGHHGKALVPKESPYEQRQQATESPDDRAPKRRKYDDPPPSKSGYAAALFGQTLTLSATPSSSVPAIRRLRPEARSDPPAEADTQDTREDRKPPMREQPQSSRRLNQSGYAQSLFGQTLTLSHTPVSSVPSRPQPRIEPASSPAVENNRHDPRETTQTEPPQQPTESRQPGQLGSKSRSTLLNNRSSMGNSVAKGGADIEASKEFDSVSRKNHARNAVHTVPDNVDIIEIDDPEPVASPPLRQSKTHKRSSASLPSNEDKMHRSEGAMGQDHTAHGDSIRSRKQRKLSPGRKHDSEKTKNHETTKEPETAASKAKSGKSSSGRMDPAPLQKIGRVPTVTRDPALPVTELRIKSSKKRGLLMISDPSKAKKTRRNLAADSGRSFEGGSRHHLTDSDVDDPFRSPPPRSTSKLGNGGDVDESGDGFTTGPRQILRKGDDYDNHPDYPIPNGDRGLENKEETHELGKKSAQRTISTELGEDDDPFHSSRPTNSEQTYPGPKPATRDSNTIRGDARPESVKTTAQDTSDAVQPTKPQSSPPQARHDPYEIPSSPQASSPGNSSSAQRKRRGNDVVDDILRPIDNNKKLSKAKNQRHSRRKIVSDDDDGNDTESLAPLPAKTIPQEDISLVESADEKPKRAARKSRGQQQGLVEASDEDALPIKRRQSTRQRRSRAASREEPSPLPSEQESSEEEKIPMKRRKTKISKASEDRPRLERIKKNVKSRELVGFNLAALNAPLGLRGIGMPFSVLPSPVNESIQRSASKHAAEDETKTTAVVNECDVQMDAQEHHAAAPTSQSNATEILPKRSLPSLNQPVQDKRPTLHRQSSAGVNQKMCEDVSPEASKTMMNAQTPPVPPTAPATKPSVQIGGSVQDRSRAIDKQLLKAGQVIDEKTNVPSEEAVVTEKIATDPRADDANKPQAAASLNQHKPRTRRQPSTHEPAHAPNAVETDQAAPAGGLIASSVVEKPTPALHRQSSAIVDQNTVAVETTRENPDSSTASNVPVRQPKIIGLRRQVSAPRSINNIAAKSAPQIETTEASPTDVHTKSASNARLANPASRGRKAALASDAAGQAPQRILPPTQPALMVPISTADLAMTPIEQAQKEPERPKKKMTFPGFQSARSDGPWSREAFDLLESGRPV